jgi:hypothetical protein
MDSNAVARLRRVAGRQTHSCAIGLLLCLAVPMAAPAQTPVESHYRQFLENHYVRVFRVELPPHSQAPIYQNTHDLVWVALSDSTLSIELSEGERKEWWPRAGDTRFFGRHESKSVWNTSRQPFHGVLVEIMVRGLASGGCGCTGEVEKAVCGCARTIHLPDLWALVVGKITLGGTTLSPGESTQGAEARDDTLLIAVVPLQLHDDAGPRGEGGSSLTLAAGEVRWVKEGRHQFRNIGTGIARFVTIEF